MSGWGQFLTGGAALGLITAIIQFILTRPKVRAEAAKAANEAAGIAQTQLRDIITDLNVRIDQQDARIGRLEAKNADLELSNDELSDEARRGRLRTQALVDGFRRLSQWAARYYEAGAVTTAEPPPLLVESEWPLLDERGPAERGAP